MSAETQIVFPGLLICFIVSPFVFLRQSVVRDKFLQSPSLIRAKAVRRALAIEWLATVVFSTTLAGLFLVLGLMLGAPFHIGIKRDWLVVLAIAGYIAAGLLRLVFNYWQNRRYIESYWENVSLPDNSGRQTPYFVASQRVGLLLDRSYVLYLARPMLCGGVASRATFLREGRRSANYNPDLWIDATFELLYDRIDLTKPEFLALNKLNFQLAWGDIERIDFVPSKLGWLRVRRNSGRITIRSRNGRVQDFVLVGAQDGEGLKKVLDRALAVGEAKDLSAAQLVPAA